MLRPQHEWDGDERQDWEEGLIVICLESLHPEAQEMAIQLKGGRLCHEFWKITSKAGRSVKRPNNSEHLN